jgi:catechol 2,3-dioxygenase-like lactoylglutathione lyase family enzyme
VKEVAAVSPYPENKKERTMGLELYMVGVVVEDMARAVEFYRRLGVDVPEGSETKHHVEVKMSGLTFFLTTKVINARWDPARTDASGGYRMILEFYLETQQAVDDKYAEMIGYGYESHHPPFVTPFKIYFAFVNDPDGNTILLSGELPKEGESA